jgi:hypothetical protein
MLGHQLPGGIYEVPAFGGAWAVREQKFAGDLGFHFSFDDVFSSLIHASDTGESLFNQPFFAFLRELHEAHGVGVDLYLFYEKYFEGRLRTLKDVCSRFREEIQDAGWLRFGPHGLDPDRHPYTQTPFEQREAFSAIFSEIDRFAGEGSRSPFVRLHYFSEALELAPYWLGNGVTTMFLTDKPAISYRLPEKKKQELGVVGHLLYDGLMLRRSHDRMEFLVDDGVSDAELSERLDRYMADHELLVLFSHEIDAENPKVREMCHRCLAQVKEKLVQVGGRSGGSRGAL